MGFFRDWRSHYTVGFAYGIALRATPKAYAEKKIIELDHWAWEREWEQNLVSTHPNEIMSAHQQQEARAWGDGARAARGVNPPRPSPPYPVA